MRYLLSLISILCCTLIINAQSLTEIEYYFDKDPGFGNGIKLPVDTEFETTVNISQLKNGVHSIFIRAKDSDNNWSLLQQRTFNKVGISPSKPTLQKVEYYIDKDPGLGQGKPIEIPTGESAFDASVNRYAIDLTAMNDGVHTIYIRAKDNNEHWSLLQSRTFIKLPPIEQVKVTDIQVKIDGTDEFSDWVSIGGFSPAEDVSVDFEVNSNNLCQFLDEEIVVEVIAINDMDYASNITSKDLKIGCADEDDFCPSILSYNIIDHESFPNQTEYEIMETGIVHHFFQITDVDGNPLKEGIEIYYTVDRGNGLPVKERVSKPSNEDGIVNLYFNTNWDDEATPESELVEAGSNVKISFRRMYFPQEYKDNQCLKMEQNDFTDIEIRVGELKPSSKEYGLFANGSVGGSVCLVCVPGYSTLDLGLKGKLGSSLSFQNRYNEQDELSSVILKTKLKAGLIPDVGLGEISGIPKIPVNISVNLFEGNFNAWAKTYCKFEVDAQTLNYLFLFYHIITYTNKKSIIATSNNNLLEKVLEILLDKVYKNISISKLEAGSSYEYGAGIELGEIGIGEIIKFLMQDSSDENENIKTKFNATVLDVDVKQEKGIKIKFPKKITRFYKHSGQQKWVDTKFGVENAENNVTFSFLNTTALENFKRGFEYSLEIDNSTNKKNAEIKCNNVYEALQIESQPYDIEYSQKFKLNNEVMDYLKSKYDTPLGNIDNQLIKYLLLKDSKPSANLSTAYYEIDNLLRDINQNSNEAFIEVSQNKFITNKKSFADFKLDEVEKNFELFPKTPKLLRFGVGADLNTFIDVGVFSSTSLPSLSSGKYSSVAKGYLWSVEYPKTEKLNALVKNPLAKLWDYIAESIESNFDKFLEAIGVVIKFVDGVIKDGAVWFVNEVREVISGKNENAFIFKDFSKIAIGYKDDGSVFNPNSEVTLEYYYPEGEVKGITENEDTIIIVSDLFYLNALENEEYLTKAPNGEYMIIATLGKDDLAFLGMNENTEAEVFHRPLDELYWRSIGSANGDTLKYDGLGNLAIGVYLDADYESPTVDIQQNENNQFSAFISDNTGIDWSTVSVSINGNNVAFNRVNLTNEIIFNIDSLLISENKDYIITVHAYDLLNNYGFANLSAETGTNADEILVFNHLLKLFPNPASKHLNILYQIPESGNVKFEITDVLGKQIVQKQISNTKVSIPLVEKLSISSASPGIYVLNIYLKDKIIEARKFVVR